MRNSNNGNDTYKQEKVEVNQFAKNISIESFKNGEWFLKLIKFALENYRKNVNAEYFQKKYPDLLPDAIVDRRIDIAKKHAAIEGGTTAAAYSGAIAATIGTKGGSSPFTIPAAATAIALDLCYTSYIQLRLAYDISVLYGKPLNIEDPEDLKNLLILAFGIRAGETFQDTLQKLAPEATRVTIKKTITGDSLKYLQALPVVGKYLLQRNIIKMLIPIIAIGLGTSLNYYFTDKTGKRARSIFRSRVAIEESTVDYVFSDVEYIPLLLSAVWLIIKSDGETKQEEIWYLKYLIENLREIEGADEFIQSFAKRINFSDDIIFKEIDTLDDKNKKAIYEAVCIASVVDRKIRKQEEEVLIKFAEVCGCKFNKSELIKLSKKFK